MAKKSIQTIRQYTKSPLVPVIAISTVIILSVMIIGVIFYVHGKGIMENQLKEKLRSIAASAAMQFDGDTIATIRDGDTMQRSKVLRETVQKLQTLRESVTNVRYAYIMKKTDNPDLLSFVADADLALSEQELDEDGNGVIDENEQASLPGDLYDWTEFPKLGTEAFLHSTVDDHVGEDQWGPIISGYAPILRSNGQVVAILGIDMAADEYVKLTRSIFSPIALLLTIIASISFCAGGTMLFWRKRLENINRLENERSGLLRLAFHQLGGPLTIINWSLEELEEEGPASIQRTIINIHEGVKRLSEILKMLKSADLVHAGKIEYKPEFASLTSILERVAKRAESKTALRKQKISLRLEENITMKLDPKLIEGVTEEILTNAIDFSKNGAEIIIRSKRIGREAEFSIIDSGCGIPKRDLHRIFDEFSRGSNATNFKADGNGLGLYIVRGIVKQAGGRVIIASKEGEGTTVTVRLPIAPEESGRL